MAKTAAWEMLDITILWILPTSSSRKCTLKAARITNIFEKKAKRPRGKIFGPREKDFKDSYIGKMNIKRYLIWFWGHIDSWKAVWNILRNFGCISMSLFMAKSKLVSSNSTAFGKICTMKGFWKISLSSTFWTTSPTNMKVYRATIKSRYPKTQTGTF